MKFTIVILGEIEKKLNEKHKKKRDNQSPPKKKGHYTKICARCNDWRNQRIRYTCRYKKLKPRIAELTSNIMPGLREAITRRPPKMNNRKRFITEETRTYLNKRNGEERLNRRNR